jgi:twinkle protein
MPMAHEDSEFVCHVQCESCGSSDANAQYDDGHTHCFSCGAHTRGDGEANPNSRRKKMAGDLIEAGEVKGLRTRNITDETCKKFGYTVAEYKGKTVQVAPYYDADGNLVGQKLRGKDKSFSVKGSLDNALPFGAHAFQKTGRRVIVTEGEIDALSMSQVQGNKYPVVSLPNGAQSAKKHFAKMRDYYLGFEEVVLLFDMDEPGRKAAKEAAEVLGSRAKIAELPLKDANEMLVAGRVAELLDAPWRAKAWRPDGIVDLASLKDQIRERPKEGLSWVFPALTKLTYGKRLGELCAVGAGTGVGKTDFFTQDMVHMVRVHGQKIGIFSLEQKPSETGLRFVGKAAERPLHIPDYWDEAVFDRTWQDMVREGKVFLYDNFGATEWSVVQNQIEYLYHAEGVQYFYLDHLTALAAAEENEKEGLEQIMADMGALVKRIPIHITFISHLATPEKGSHEEGARVTIRQFKGSRAIGYWAHWMFGLERNQQAENEAERTITTFRVLKDRYTGRATGQVFYLGYDFDTGMLFETEKPKAASEHGFDDEDEPAGESKGGDF